MIGNNHMFMIDEIVFSSMKSIGNLYVNHGCMTSELDCIIIRMRNSIVSQA